MQRGLEAVNGEKSHAVKERSVAQKQEMVKKATRQRMGRGIEARKCEKSHAAKSGTGYSCRAGALCVQSEIQPFVSKLLRLIPFCLRTACRNTQILV